MEAPPPPPPPPVNNKDDDDMGGYVELHIHIEKMHALWLKVWIAFIYIEPYSYLHVPFGSQ